MNWNTARARLGTLARLVLGVVWVWASWSKLHSPRTFVQAVRAYDATPEWLSKAIGYGLPVLEFCLGVLLIVGVTIRIAAAVSGLLLLVFLVGVAQAAARGIKLDCGCFGGGGTTEGTTQYTLDILRDVGLFALALYLLIWSVTSLSLEGFLERNDYVEMPSAKRMRTQQGRRKYESQVQARRKQARDRNLYLTSLVSVVVVLVTIVGIGVQAGRAKIAGTLTATNASVGSGVTYGKHAAARVDVYEDFACPHCREFEKAVSSQLDKDVKANLAQVRYYPLSILDRLSTNSYSTRAANAALCASDAGANQFLGFHNVLYGEDAKGKQVQPAEGSAGPSNTMLVAYAQYKSVGMTAAQVTTFTQCVTGKQHYALVAAITERASQRGISSTPTVIVNGKTLTKQDLKTLEAAIAAADAKGPAPAPSPTNSASPSASNTGTATTTTSAPSSGSTATP